MNAAARVYSPAQKEAIEVFGKDICVAAGAGSGKTSVLVERFLYAVTKMKVDAERILAITFTDKAASEMKSRLVEACRRRPDLADFRRKLENAYISTIHSFCSRLLKENPIEAGLDPFFRILSDPEARILRVQVMDRLFEEQSQNAAWLEVLCELEEDNARAAIDNYYALKRATGGDESIFQWEPAAAKKREARVKIIQAARELASCFGPRDLTEMEVRIKSGAEEIIELMSSPTADGWDKIHSLSGAANKGLHRRIPKYRHQVESVRALAQTWIAFALHELGKPYAREFKRICALFEASYDREKQKMACYDFEDLLFKVYRLLSSSEAPKKAVRERTRDFFACILVDEHQDTSPLQDKIIDLLRNKDNLFLVGDIQQSIYGFRHADPEVFQQRILKNRRSGKNIVLTENYRSRIEILNFVNGVFKRLPQAPEIPLLMAHRSFQKPMTHPVELLCVLRDREEAADLDAARVLEARSMAGRIEEMVGSGMLVEEKTGHVRAIRYGDIAMLFRSTTRSYLYEKELVDFSIPYVLSKGQGFYEKPEILDLVNFLKLVENPQLDIALAGVLRSPLVQISDDALFWLAAYAKRIDRKAPLSQGLDSLSQIMELSQADRAKIVKYQELVSNLRERKESFSLSEIIQEILRKTNVEAKLLAREGGRQRVANIHKLVRIAESVEQKNLFGIQDFIRALESLKEQEVPEAEERIAGESGNAVTLSTIHAAKGLEFPCVFVADMGRRESSSRRASFVSLPGIGMGLKLKNPLTQEPQPDSVYTQIDEILKKREAAEERRLLYVAMTRAEQHLVLSGSAEWNAKEGQWKQNGSWMAEVASILGGQPDSAPSLTRESAGPHFEGIKIKWISAVDKTERNQPPTSFLAQDPKVNEALLNFKPDETAFGEIQKRFLPIQKEYDQTEDHSVTDLLMAFRGEAPSGAGVYAQEDNRPEAGEEPATPRNEYGTIFHRLMENLAPRRTKKISPSDLSAYILRPLSRGERSEMRKSALRFWNGRWGHALRKARVCYAELPFIYKTKHGLLKGQIDLVFQDADGRWILLDYKTNPITAAQKKAVAESYRLQLSIYALIFKKLYGAAPQRGVFYFSAIDQEVEYLFSENDFHEFEDLLERYFLKACAL